MTKDELQAKVAKQQSIINDANDEICSCVNDYIESLPYKVGDKVSCYEEAHAINRQFKSFERRYLKAKEDKQ